MAIYHMSVKAVSRSAGRCATAAAAYRAGARIEDERTGDIHDYERRTGVMSADIILPDGAPLWATDRSALWNAAEAAERRKDSCVAREYEVALPSELSEASRRELAIEFAREMANREGCAVDVAIHAPNRKGDQRTYHAHILRTTRRIGAEGLSSKLDTEKAGRNRAADLQAVRERWEEMVNEHLGMEGHSQRVDHRSLAAQKVSRSPQCHLGPAATGFERRTGQSSQIRRREYARLRAQQREREALAQQAIHEDNEVRYAAVKLGQERWNRLSLKENADAVYSVVRVLPVNLRSGSASIVSSLGEPSLDYLDWYQAVCAEQKGVLAESVEQARQVAEAYRANVLNPHAARKPLLFGKDAWQRRLNELCEVDGRNVTEWERRKAGRWSETETERAGEEAREHVRARQPDLAQAGERSAPLLVQFVRYCHAQQQIEDKRREEAQRLEREKQARAEAEARLEAQIRAEAARRNIRLTPELVEKIKTGYMEKAKQEEKKTVQPKRHRSRDIER